MQSSPYVTKSPRWSLALYLFLATLPCDILSAFVFCNRLVYPCYVATPQLFSMASVQDQKCAAAMMWVWVTFAYLIPAVAITAHTFLLEYAIARINPNRAAGRHGIGAKVL